MAHINHGDRHRAEADYREARLKAMMLVEPEVQQMTGLNVGLKDIDSNAIQAAESWRSGYAEVDRATHEPGWDWAKQLKKFRRRPRRVELAIWVDEHLCGLALGRISDRCIVATIHFLEGNPIDNPLQGKVIPIATRYLEVLALGLGCKEASVELPLPDLISVYKEMGFVREVTKGQKILRLKKAVTQ